MAFDYSELRGRIVTKCGNQSEFAKRIGMKPQALSRKLNNQVGITKEEILDWSEILEIEPPEFGKYFFTLKV